jgi:hypothetical protein
MVNSFQKKNARHERAILMAGAKANLFRLHVLKADIARQFDREDIQVIHDCQDCSVQIFRPASC